VIPYRLNAADQEGGAGVRFLGRFLLVGYVAFFTGIALYLPVPALA
jgi:hypothetical protein